MKAIFAVSALAAAISAQAIAADTEATTTFTGGLKFVTEFDMSEGITNADGDDASNLDVYNSTEDDADDEGGYGLYMNVDVVNGPFSGSLSLEGEDGNATVSVGDVVITEGKLSFGQVGSLVETHEYAYDMGDSQDDLEALGLTVNTEGLDADAGIRYMVMEGLHVQLEGAQGADENGSGETYATGSDYGFGALYTGEAGALSYTVDAQFRASTLAPEDSNPFIYVGAGATYSADMFEVKVAANNYSYTETDLNDESITEVGYEVKVMPIDAATAYAKGVLWDLGDTLGADGDLDKFLFGATYTIDAVTLTGEYLLVGAEESGDEVFAEVAYEQDNISAYGSVTLADFDADESEDPYLEAGVSMTTESGIVYAADYDFQSEGDNKVAFSAAYNF